MAIYTVLSTHFKNIFFCRNNDFIHVFQASTRGKRSQHSAFSLNPLPALTWRLTPGPSLHPDQLTIRLYSLHLVSLQKGLQRPSMQQGTRT